MFSVRRELEVGLEEKDEGDGRWVVNTDTVWEEVFQGIRIGEEGMCLVSRDLEIWARHLHSAAVLIYLERFITWLMAHRANFYPIPPG